MACGDVLSLEDLQTAKKHQIFEAEVITGKAGGVAGGADIGYATNQVTGQTQQTLPSILADLGFDVQSWTSSTGGVLASANQVFLNDTSGSLGLGDYYAWGGPFPKTVPAGTDPALVGSGYIMRSSRLAGVQAREALRRSYAEAGYNLVNGSFEAGGTLVNSNDVLLHEASGKAYTGPSGEVGENSTPTVDFTDVSYTVGRAVSDFQHAARLDLAVGSIFRVASRNNALFEIKSGDSSYSLVNPQITTDKFCAIVPISGEISTSASGASDYDDTFILNELIKYAKSIMAAVNVDSRLTLRTPLDEHTYIRLPTYSTIYSKNAQVYPITIRPQAGSVRDAALCLESFKGLMGPQPAMCQGTVARKIALRMSNADGGEVKVGHCLIGGMFRSVFEELEGSGFTRHNILICRTWYATYSRLFGSQGFGSGVTIGKHPDINQAWDGAVNAVYIDEIWAHGNGRANTWVADTAEDIGYGLGLYGQMYSVHIGAVACELNKGSGFQNKMQYGNAKVGSVYIEANTGFGFYGASTASHGITWEFPNIYLSPNSSVKIKPDSNTYGAEIGFTFSSNASSITFDFTGVDPSRVKLSKNTAYTLRNKLKSMFQEFKIVSSGEGNLNSYTVVCRGTNPVKSLDLNNNMELVFVPYVTTSLASSVTCEIYKNGGVLGVSRATSGPFTAYVPVVLYDWSGEYGAFYTYRIGSKYAEDCPGMFTIRARHT